MPIKRFINNNYHGLDYVFVSSSTKRAENNAPGKLFMNVVRAVLVVNICN